jgi:two-component system sensor histidine kinase UhpB
VVIALGFTPRAVALSIADDGDGMASGGGDQVSQGLADMEERAAEIAATLRIEPAAGGGTRVSVEVPA